MFAQQRLYLTADKAKLVPEGDEDAATLYASPGDEIPDSAAERFGLVDGALPATGAPTPSRKKGSAVKKESENKGGKAVETKEAASDETKGAGGATSPAGDPPADASGE